MNQSGLPAFSLDFLNSALNDLNAVFSRVGDKRSCSAGDKLEFTEITKSIYDCYERYEERTVDRELSTLSATAVLDRLNDLNEQFANIRQEMNDKFVTLENRIQHVKSTTKSVHTPGPSGTKSYADVLRAKKHVLPDMTVVKQTESDMTVVKQTEHPAASISSSGVLSSAKQKFIISGSGKTSRLKPALRFPRRSAIFLSRLDQSTRVNDVLDSLASLDLKHLVCTKMKTKFSNYSSFHIEVLDSDLQVLLKEDLWPDGCIVSKFMGRLRPDQIVESVGTNPDSGDTAVSNTD